jgi:dihydroxyacetone kinase DhaKLM complex PTS-EIIA-like component DhaM
VGRLGRGDGLDHLQRHIICAVLEQAAAIAQQQWCYMQSQFVR